MPELFTAVTAEDGTGASEAVGVHLRAGDPATLGARFRAWCAAQDPTYVLRHVRIGGAGDGATWCLQAIGSTRAVPSDPGIPFADVEAAFRVVTDSEANLSAQWQECIQEIVARRTVPGPPPVLPVVDLRESFITGAGAGHVWLVGVIAQWAPPV